MPPNGAAIQPENYELCYGTLLRPLLLALKVWVEEYVKPPSNCFPSVMGEASYPFFPLATRICRALPLRE